MIGTQSVPGPLCPVGPPFPGLGLGLGNETWTQWGWDIMRLGHHGTGT